MDMFAVDEEVADWETALLPLRGAERLALLLPLAWHLRQRDTGRAVGYAHEALALLAEAPFTVTERASAECPPRLRPPPPRTAARAPYPRARPSCTRSTS